jgi:uncharacterized protein YggT (Ycf19 family)
LKEPLKKVQLNGVLVVDAINLYLLALNLFDMVSWVPPANQDIDHFLAKVLKRLLAFRILLHRLVFCLRVMVKHLGGKLAV